MTSRYILVQKLLLLVIIVLTVAIAAMCWGAFLTDEWITAWGLSARSIPYPDAAASAFNVSSSTPVSLTIGTRRYCVQRHCTTKGPAGFESESTCGRSAANIDSRYTTAYVFTFFSALIACVEMIVLIGRLTALDPASFAYTSPARAGGGGGGAGATATTSTNPMKVPTPVTGNSPDDETAMMSSAEVHPVRHAVVATTTPSPRAGLEPVTIEPLTVTRERRAATVGTTKQAALVGAVLRVSPVGVVNFFLLLISVAIIADLENSYLNCGNSTTCNRLIVTSTVLGLPGANCGWGSSFGLIIAATVLSLAVLALGCAWGVAAQRSVEHELSEGYDEDDEAAPPRASFEPAAESKEGISADVGSAMFSSSAIRHPEHSGSLAASPSEQYANDRPNRPPEANM